MGGPWWSQYLPGLATKVKLGLALCGLQNSMSEGISGMIYDIKDWCSYVPQMKILPILNLSAVALVGRAQLLGLNSDFFLLIELYSATLDKWSSSEYE